MLLIEYSEGAEIPAQDESEFDRAKAVGLSALLAISFIYQPRMVGTYRRYRRSKDEQTRRVLSGRGMVLNQDRSNHDW